MSSTRVAFLLLPQLMHLVHVLFLIFHKFVSNRRNRIKHNVPNPQQQQFGR
jgi:hypothetical protein